MENYKKTVSFLDAEGHRARVTVEVTHRNGYPEFTASGTFLGSGGQCLDSIKPANDEQRELIALWEKHHLKDVSRFHKFVENLEGVLARIEYTEAQRAKLAKEKEGDEAILAKMEEEGIREEQLEAVKAYILLGIEQDGEIEDFEESYQGEYMSDEEFTRDMVEQMGIEIGNTWPHNCIDWERASYELMMDYSMEGGHYFRNM